MSMTTTTTATTVASRESSTLRLSLTAAATDEAAMSDEEKDFRATLATMDQASLTEHYIKAQVDVFCKRVVRNMPVPVTTDALIEKRVKLYRVEKLLNKQNRSSEEAKQASEFVNDLYAEGKVWWTTLGLDNEIQTVTTTQKQQQSKQKNNKRNTVTNKKDDDNNDVEGADQEVDVDDDTAQDDEDCEEEEDGDYQPSASKTTSGDQTSASEATKKSKVQRLLQSEIEWRAKKAAATTNLATAIVDDVGLTQCIGSLERDTTLTQLLRTLEAAMSNGQYRTAGIDRSRQLLSFMNWVCKLYTAATNDGATLVSIVHNVATSTSIGMPTEGARRYSLQNLRKYKRIFDLVIEHDCTSLLLLPTCSLSVMTGFVKQLEDTFNAICYEKKAVDGVNSEQFNSVFFGDNADQSLLHVRQALEQFRRELQGLIALVEGEERAVKKHLKQKAEAAKKKKDKSKNAKQDRRSRTSSQKNKKKRQLSDDNADDDAYDNYDENGNTAKQAKKKAKRPSTKPTSSSLSTAATAFADSSAFRQPTFTRKQ